MPFDLAEYRAAKEKREAEIAALPPFDRFWEHTPSAIKIDKRACRKKFDAITSPKGLHTKAKDNSTGGYYDDHLQATPDEIIDGWKRYVARQTDAEFNLDKFTRHPLTWLNKGNWDD